MNMQLIVTVICIALSSASFESQNYEFSSSSRRANVYPSPPGKNGFRSNAQFPNQSPNQSGTYSNTQRMSGKGKGKGKGFSGNQQNKGYGYQESGEKGKGQGQGKGKGGGKSTMQA